MIDMFLSVTVVCLWVAGMGTLAIRFLNSFVDDMSTTTQILRGALLILAIATTVTIVTSVTGTSYRLCARGHQVDRSRSYIWICDEYEGAER